MLRAVGGQQPVGDSSSEGVAVGPEGVRIGRDPSRCRIVIPDVPENCMVGREQAFVVPDQGRLMLINLGSNPTYIQGEAVTGSVDLDDGAVLQFEESPVAVAVTGSKAEVSPPRRKVAWRLDGGTGQTYGIVGTPFSVGGGAGDQLHVDGWPEGSLRFLLAQDALYLEAGRPVLCNGDPVPEDAPRSLNHGDKIEHEGRTFVVLAMAAGGGPATTVVKARETLPVEVELHYLPRGANLVVKFINATHNAVLTEKQTDLAGALLQPRHGVKAGEYIEDQELLDRIWPRDFDKTQKTLNLLVHQLRSRLVESELDGNVIIAKPRGHGATRFTLAQGAKVRVITN